MKPERPGWNRLQDTPFPTNGMFIWARPNKHGSWGVGLAYWTVSGKWRDAYGDPHAAHATHWHRMPDIGILDYTGPLTSPSQPSPPGKDP